MTPSPQFDLLNALGYALFERTAQGVFRLSGETPGWLAPFLPNLPENLPLAEIFPFLEVFLLDAEEFWSAPNNRPNLRSDYWTQLDSGGAAWHLSATALPHGALLIESAPDRYSQAQAQIHHAHEAALAYREIAKLSRELERATNAKSEFLARMSHEIRTPMNALIGMAELLSETPLTAEQREYVRIFRKAGDNLLKIVNDVLDFSKIEAGQVELENIAFDLPALVQEAIDVVSHAARAKGLTLASRIEPAVPTHLMGDPGRLRQVLLNLLGNAIKFTSQGEVAVLVSAAPAGPLHFIVSDTGIGIPPDRLSSMFESFTQADAGTSRTYGGTGLGLAISKSFVEMMGGRIWAESTPGAGTQIHFTLTLAVAPAQPAEPSQSTEDLSPKAPLRILLADDSEDNRLVVRGYLKNTGHLIDEAENGAVALEKFQRAAYDLVLTDVEMPVLDGLSAVRAMRAYERQSNRPPVPILALTAHAFTAAAAQSLAAGCTGHLPKPIRKAALLAAIAPYERAASAAHTQEPAEAVESWLQPIVPAYLAKRRADVATLRAALAAADYPAIRLLGHQLAGTGSSFGFDEISTLGAELEDAASAPDTARLPALIDRLELYLRDLPPDGTASLETKRSG